MNKRFLEILKKYNFIILFCASFAAYMSVMGVQAFSQPKETQKEQQIAEQRTETGSGIEDQRETLKGLEDAQTSEESNGQPNEQEFLLNPPKSSFTTADASYLDGALFIGDSRTVTLSAYAGWENTTFYVETGLTIWKVMEANIVTIGEETMSVRSALSRTSFDKIYIMLGINELGFGTPDSFCEQYRSVINEIRSLQPQAIIYIESILHVTQSKDDEQYYINNNEINMRNEKLRTLADDIYVFWIDENEVFDAPGTGKLNPEYTSDGIHLKPMCIQSWQDFLLNHAIVR